MFVPLHELIDNARRSRIHIIDVLLWVGFDTLLEALLILIDEGLSLQKGLADFFLLPISHVQQRHRVLWIEVW